MCIYSTELAIFPQKTHNKQSHVICSTHQLHTYAKQNKSQSKRELNKVKFSRNAAITYSAPETSQAIRTFNFC
jgi:hypothetical protein